MPCNRIGTVFPEANASCHSSLPHSPRSFRHSSANGNSSGHPGSVSHGTSASQSSSSVAASNLPYGTNFPSIRRPSSVSPKGTLSSSHFSSPPSSLTSTPRLNPRMMMSSVPSGSRNHFRPSPASTVSFATSTRNKFLARSISAYESSPSA